MLNNQDLKFKIQKHLKEYVVTYIFLLLSLIFVSISNQSLNAILSQLVSRLTRNLFMVLALIIPIVAGMGINFAITIGAMAAQIGLLLALNWKITGFLGILTAGAITVPLGALFGFLIGTLLNKMKGQETIGSMILGYFANGAYQLLFLFIFGKFIPLNDHVKIIGSTGVANTLNLIGESGLYYAVDGILSLSFTTTLYIVSGICIVGSILLLALGQIKRKKGLGLLIGSLLAALLYSIPVVKAQFNQINVPIVTFLFIGLLCLFNALIMKTRLGQKFRAVGQNRTVANAAGINVNAVRMKAIIISTILAGWGQILFIQSLGTLQTYTAHEMVGLYAGAAILVGGASIDRATNTQALIGCLLFHTLFVVAQDAGIVLLGDPNVGEYFRVFLCYGAIAVALVMYAWRGNEKRKKTPIQG